MRARQWVGILLIVLGVFAFATGGFSFTTSDTVADVGPLELQREERHRVPLSPILGGICLVAGVVLLVVRPRART